MRSRRRRAGLDHLAGAFDSRLSQSVVIGEFVANELYERHCGGCGDFDMPPYLALTLTLGFLTVSLWADSEASSRLSRAAWPPFIWMLICASRSLSDWLDASAPNQDFLSASLQGNVIDQAFLALLVALAAPTLWKRRGAVAEILGRNKTICVFFVYLGISTIWSDISLISLRRWFRLLAGLLMVIVILTERNPYEAAATLVRRSAYLLVPLSLLCIKYFPDFGVWYTKYGEQIVAGVTLEKNTLGHLTCVSALFLFWSLITFRGVGLPTTRTWRWIIDWVVLIASVYLLIVSKSSTSLAALFVGVFVCLLVRFQVIRSNIRSIGILALIAIFVFAVLEMLFGIVGIVIEMLGRDTTVTGRAPLWALLVDLGLQRPVLGYGYGGFWTGERFDIVYDAFKLTIHIGHNGYLETFVEAGFVGLFLLVLVIVAAFNTIKRVLLLDFDYGVLCLALFIMILLCNVTESSFAKPQDYLWFVFLLISVGIPVSAAGSRVRAATKLSRS